MHLNVTGIGGLILLALDIWALVSVIGSAETTGKKVIWVLVILFLPLLGFIAWLIIGPARPGLSPPCRQEEAMKLTICRDCGEMLHFENSACLECGAPLGFLPGDLYLTTVVPHPDGTVESVTRPGERWRRCANAEAALCNWLHPRRQRRGILRRLPAQPHHP